MSTTICAAGPVSPTRTRFSLSLAPLLALMACATGAPTSPPPASPPAVETTASPPLMASSPVPTQPSGQRELKIMVAPKEGVAQRISDISKDPHRPPPPGSVVWGVFKVCVTTTGVVEKTSAIKSTGDGDVDNKWLAAMQTWVHRPLLREGLPVAFCYPIRLQVIDGVVSDANQSR